MSKTPKRVITAVLALLLGFGASWIAFRASDSAISNQAQGTLLGPLDFAAYCRAEHGQQAEAVHTRIDAYGWRCAFSVHGRYQVQEIDLDRACSTLFDGVAYSRSFDVNAAYSWQCFRGHKP